MKKSDRSPRGEIKSKLKGPQARPRWTKEEVALLRRLYRSHSNAEIAKVVGRKVSSVVFKGHRLGLSKGVRRLREMGQENIRQRWDGEKRARGTGSRIKSGRSKR